jgi:cysteinyl-tRNA synthetase
LAVRQLILNSHYRSPIDFSDAALFAAQSGYNKITETVRVVRKAISIARDGEIDKETTEQLNRLRHTFEVAMNNDLNTSIALSFIFELVRVTQRLFEHRKTNKQTLTVIDGLFKQLGGDVLGIIRDEYDQQNITDDIQRYELAITGFIELRNKARREKNFQLADEIRGKLGSVGIVLEDKPDATTWRLG